MASQVADIEAGQERYHLDGFAESHFVADNPPGLLAVELPQPLGPRLLVPAGEEGEGRRRGQRVREPARAKRC